MTTTREALEWALDYVERTAAGDSNLAKVLRAAIAEAAPTAVAGRNEGMLSTLGTPDACSSCGRTAAQGADLMHGEDAKGPTTVCERCDELLTDLQWMQPCPSCGHAIGFHHGGPCEWAWKGSTSGETATFPECDCSGAAVRAADRAALPEAAQGVTAILRHNSGSDDWYLDYDALNESGAKVGDTVLVTVVSRGGGR